MKFLSGMTFWAIASDRLSVADSRVSEALYVSCNNTNNCTIHSVFSFAIRDTQSPGQPHAHIMHMHVQY